MYHVVLQLDVSVVVLLAVLPYDVFEVFFHHASLVIPLPTHRDGITVTQYVTRISLK